MKDQIATRLKEARKAAGFANAREAAAALGVEYPTYAAHENGSRKPDLETAGQYARRYKASLDWLINGRGKGPAAPTMVPLMGYVGAGAATHFYAESQGELERVPAPLDATKDTVAVQIRGESLGALFDTWLVYYDEVRSPVTQDMIGRLCVVGLPDDRVLVKRIKRSRTPGLFHLESNTEPTILDVEISWAAKVKSMEPR